MVSHESKLSPVGSEDDSPQQRAMRSAEGGNAGKRRRKARPLDETSLRDLALSYVARFSTTGAKLEGYLARKLRERGVEEDEEGRARELDVTGLVTRFIELGYIDDDAYAKSKSRDLTARGYGARRVEQALWAAGVEEGVRADHAPGEAESRRAVVLLAKKRRFGPFARPAFDDEAQDPAQRRKLREKQVAALLRAGHLFEHAAFILDAAGEDEIDEWLAEAEEESREEGGLW